MSVVPNLKPEEIDAIVGGQAGPYTEVWYTIQWGDTLSGIAVAFRTSVGAIMALNPSITDPNKIYAGQCIRIW